MTIFAALIIGQMIQFQSDRGYAECVGTKEQVASFYVTWKFCCDPNCQTTNKATWDRWDKLWADNLSETMLFQNDRATRLGIAKAVFYRGLWVRFRVRIDPFGSFWVYYSPWVHVAATIGFLLGVIWWLKRRMNRQCKSSPA